jgi:hypothetical protein
VGFTALILISAALIFAAMFLAGVKGTPATGPQEVEAATLQAKPRAHISVLSLPAIRVAARSAARARCKQDEAYWRGTFTCPKYRWWGRGPRANAWSYGCVYRSLTFRKASCETEYFLRSGVNMAHDQHCYGRITYRGNGTTFKQSGRYRVDCTLAWQV